MTTWLVTVLTVALIGSGSAIPPSNGDPPGAAGAAIGEFSLDGVRSALPTLPQHNPSLALVAAGRPALLCASPATAGLCRSLLGAGRVMARLWSPSTISWAGAGYLPATILARSNGEGPGGSGPPRGRPPWAGEPPTTTTTMAPTTTSTAPATTTTTAAPTTTATTAAPTTTATTAAPTTTATTAAPSTAATTPTTTRPPASPPTTTERAAPAVTGPTSTVPGAPTTSAEPATSTTADEETTTSMPSTTATTTTATTTESTTGPDRTNDQAIAVLDGLPPAPPTPSLPGDRGRPDPSGSLFGVAAASLAALLAYSAALAGRLVGRRRR